MYTGLAYVFCLVLHFFLLTKTNPVGDSWPIGPYTAASDSGWLVYLFAWADPDQELVLYSCCFCDITSLRTLHENALIHHSQSRLSGAEGVSLKTGHPAIIRLPQKCKYSWFCAIHVDSLASLRHVPSQGHDILPVHPKEMYYRHNLHCDGLHYPHIIHPVNSRNGQ